METKFTVTIEKQTMKWMGEIKGEIVTLHKDGQRIKSANVEGRLDKEEVLEYFDTLAYPYGYTITQK